MRNPVLRAVWTIGLAALSVAALFAQDMVGTWQGALNAKGKELRLVMKVERGKDEKLAATLYSIDQGGQPIPGVVTQQGNNLKVDVARIGGTYEGRLSSDGKMLEGTFTQGGPLPLNLVRTTVETAWAIPEPPPPPKQMDPNVDPEFEVATVKPNTSGAQGSRINVNGQGMFSTGNTSLKELMVFAFGVHPDQLVGMPGWSESDKFDIQGKPNYEGMGNDKQIRSMMTKLLAERFQLKFHTEKRETNAYTLNVDKAGPKMAANNSGVPLPGFRGGGPGLIGVNNASMDDFAGFLQARLVDRPVVNKTGLSGKYDFQLTWRPDNLPAQGPNGQAIPPEVLERPDIFTAMREQIGLQFQAEKTAVDMIVIDKIEKPSEN